MSVEALATGDFVVRQRESFSTGASFGVREEYTPDAGPQLECRIDTKSAMQSLAHAARDSAYRHEAFFSSDPGLKTTDRLKWVRSQNDPAITFATPRYLRVLAAYHEGPPGNPILWVVELDEDLTRQESESGA